MHHICDMPQQDSVTMKTRLELLIIIISLLKKSLHIEKTTERAHNYYTL